VMTLRCGSGPQGLRAHKSKGRGGWHMPLSSELQRNRL
jgi:hypothetical protein